MPKLLLDGNIFSTDSCLFTSRNRAFRYGDGFFETIKCVKGKILWWKYHELRIQKSLQMLQMPALSSAKYASLKNDVLRLCEINHCRDVARVRISFFRDDGGKYTPESNQLHVLIEAEPLVSDISFATGIIGGIARVEKPLSSLSSLKSLQCLPYILAGMEARQQGWHQAILQNTAGRIAETHIANIFCVHHQQIFTPPLAEGCIDGIIRKALLCAALPWPIHEQPIDLEQLWNADEVFCTNTIQGIQYFQKINDHIYGPPRIAAALAEWLSTQENEHAEF
ncbi:MAG: aminotransferase class IV [Thermoflavifilum aggregans]|nr:aminotransferase class IV [Thermoflavifilum aggregans]